MCKAAGARCRAPDNSEGVSCVTGTPRCVGVLFHINLFGISGVRRLAPGTGLAPLEELPTTPIREGHCRTPLCRRSDRHIAPRMLRRWAEGERPPAGGVSKARGLVGRQPGPRRRFV